MGSSYRDLYRLLYDFLNLIISGFSSGLLEAVAQDKWNWEFSAAALDCGALSIR